MTNGNDRVGDSSGSGFYYGWIIVGLTFVSFAMSTGMFMWLPTILMAPILDDFGWSTTDYVIGITIRTVIQVLLWPMVGPIMDKTGGPVRVALFSAITGGIYLVGLCFVGAIPFLAFLDPIIQFYIFFGVIGGLSMASCGLMTGPTLIPKWFITKRGRAMGISMTGTGLGPIVFTSLGIALISNLGWREACAVVGIATVLIQVPMAFFLRTKPEDMGLLPDGVTLNQMDGSSGTKSPTNQPMGDGLTRREALGTTTFWIIGLAILMGSTGYMAGQPHWVPSFQERGFGTSTIIVGTVAWGLGNAGARIFWGFLAERFRPHRLLVFDSFLAGCTIFILIYAMNGPMVVAYFAAAGFMMGGNPVLFPMVTAHFFGRAHLGAIGGVMFVFMMIPGIYGPAIVGLIRDARGDYVLAFFLVMIMWFLSSFAASIIRGPRPQTGRKNDSRDRKSNRLRQSTNPKVERTQVRAAKAGSKKLVTPNYDLRQQATQKTRNIRVPESDV